MEWISTQEAAQITGYDKETIRRLARAKAIESKKFGFALMISKSSLAEYARSRGRSVS